MKSFITLCIVLCNFYLNCLAQVVNVNPDPNGPPWMAGGHHL
jgi:hypothetical protein